MTTYQLEVIGAGWGRTGTLSLKKALEILGYNPCYHMMENFANNQSSEWVKAANDPEHYDFARIFNTKQGRYHAAVDFPSSTFWKEQLKQYPNAKVILSTRSPESWYKSCCETIFQFQPNAPFQPFGLRVLRFLGIFPSTVSEMMKKTVAIALHGDYSKENSIKQFKAHTDDVIKTCPPEKLLIFEAKDGWAPLCAFLGKEIPDVPYPNVNDTNEFKRNILIVNSIGYLVLSLSFVALSYGTYYVKTNVFK